MADIADLLRQTKTIAVVGLSPKTHRASYVVAAYLQAHGYRIIPINPREAGKTILSERCYANLAEARQQHQIDIVDCFRSSDDILPIAEVAIEIAARCLWMQSGIVNRDAAQVAHEAGLIVVMDRCLKTEHQRFLMSTNTSTESE